MKYLVNILTKQIVIQNEEKINFGGEWGNSNFRWFENNENLIQPFFEDDKIVEGLTDEELTTMKYNQLRKVRQNIFDNTSWIIERITADKISMEQGLTNKPKWDSSLVLEFLEWRQYLYNLPMIVNLNKYSLLDINIDNKEIFGTNPIGDK